MSFYRRYSASGRIMTTYESDNPLNNNDSEIELEDYLDDSFDQHEMLSNLEPEEVIIEQFNSEVTD